MVGSVAPKEKSRREVSTAVPVVAKPRAKEQPSDESVPTALGRKHQLTPLAMQPDSEDSLMITVGLPQNAKRKPWHCPADAGVIPPCKQEP